MNDRERELNRLKQRRFHKRHPHYDKVKKARRAEREPPKLPAVRLSGYRTFELCDPRDPEKLPRYVSICEADISPVWTRLWSVRCYSRSRLAEWFRELDAQHLTPRERPSLLNIGLSTGVPWAIAVEAVCRRLSRINKLFTGDENTLPTWSLQGENFPVSYVTLQGVVIRHQSVAEACKLRRLQRDTVARYATLVHLDKKGRTWFYG